MPSPPKKHKTILESVQKYLRQQGVYSLKYHGTNYTSRGVPDLLCCINSHFVAIEIKSERDKPSEAQKYHINLIRKAGGTAIITGSLTDIKNQLKGLLHDQNGAHTTTHPKR